MEHLTIGERTEWVLTVHIDPTRAIRAALAYLPPESVTVPGLDRQRIVEVRGTADTRDELAGQVVAAYGELLICLDDDADPSVLELYPPDGTSWTVEGLTPVDLTMRLSQRLADLEVAW